MKEVIYASEPEVIDIQVVRRMPPAHYELFLGNTSFGDAIPERCTTLHIRSAMEMAVSIKGVFLKLRSIIHIGTEVGNIGIVSRDGV